MSECPVPLITDQYFTYSSQSKSDVIVVDSNSARVDRTRTLLDADLSSQSRQLRGESMADTDQVLIEAGNQASEFLEKTLGINVSPDVKAVEGRSNQHANAAEDGTVRIFMGNFERCTPGLLGASLLTTVVHEKAHTIPSDTRRISITEYRDSGGQSTDAVVFSGLSQVLFPSLRKTSFFEEVFAESLAANLRASRVYGQDEDRTVTINYPDVGSVELPFKYVDIDEGAVKDRGAVIQETLSVNVAATFAHTVEMLNGLTETDLMQLIYAARLGDEGSIDAKRELARRINDIEHGLYRMMRDCEYDELSAAKIHVHVRNLVDNYADAPVLDGHAS